MDGVYVEGKDEGKVTYEHGRNFVWFSSSRRFHSRYLVLFGQSGEYKEKIFTFSCPFFIPIPQWPLLYSTTCSNHSS